MSTKKRFVDIVSPSIKFTDMTDQSSFVTFAEILSFMDKKEYHHNEKTFELRLLDTRINDGNFAKNGW